MTVGRQRQLACEPSPAHLGFVYGGHVPGGARRYRRRHHGAGPYRLRAALGSARRPLGREYSSLAGTPSRGRRASQGVRALREQQGAPIEQLAADLRRLRAALAGDEHRSAAHQMGNRLAYDQLMCQICEMLDIEHELGTRVDRHRAGDRAVPGRGRARAGRRDADRPALRPSGLSPAPRAPPSLPPWNIRIWCAALTKYTSKSKSSNPNSNPERVEYYVTPREGHPEPP